MGAIGKIIRIGIGVVLAIAAVILVIFGIQTTFSNKSEGAFSAMMGLTLFIAGLLLGLIGYAALKALPGYLKKKERVVPDKPDSFRVGIDKALRVSKAASFAIPPGIHDDVPKPTCQNRTPVLSLIHDPIIR